MKTFKINDELEIVCEWKKTRMAFKHEATLLKNGIEKDKVKICYQNRTWESYEFESVISELLERSAFLTQEEIDRAKDYCAEKSRGELDKQFKMVGNIAKMGELFGKTKKEANDWKARMLKAGLSNKGLIMPDDWDSLDEETKEVRLNAVIEQLN